jgi:hypothetical protein
MCPDTSITTSTSSDSTRHRFVVPRHMYTIQVSRYYKSVSVETTSGSNVTSIHVSAHYYICYMCGVYVSAHYYICYICSICVRILLHLLHVSVETTSGISITSMCPCTSTYATNASVETTSGVTLALHKNE